MPELRTPPLERLLEDVKRESAIALAAIERRALSTIRDYRDIREALVNEERLVYTTVGVNRPTSEKVFDELVVLAETVGGDFLKVYARLSKALAEFLRDAGVGEEDAERVARNTAFSTHIHVAKIIDAASRMGNREEAYALLYRAAILASTAALAAARGDVFAAALVKARLRRLAETLSGTEEGVAADAGGRREEVEA